MLQKTNSDFSVWLCIFQFWSGESSAGVVTRLRAEQAKDRGSIPDKASAFPPLQNANCGRQAHLESWAIDRLPALIYQGVKRAART